MARWAVDADADVHLGIVHPLLIEEYGILCITHLVLVDVERIEAHRVRRLLILWTVIAPHHKIARLQAYHARIRIAHHAPLVVADVHHFVAIGIAAVLLRDERIMHVSLVVPAAVITDIAAVLVDFAKVRHAAHHLHAVGSYRAVAIVKRRILKLKLGGPVIAGSKIMHTLIIISPCIGHGSSLQTKSMTKSH